MYYKKDGISLSKCDQTGYEIGRYLNPGDINIVPGYTIEVFAEGLNSPSSILFTEDGDLLIADSGYVTGNPSISRLVNNHFEIIADNFNVPLTGINYHDGNIYVSHMATISVIKSDGSRADIITGLPSYGDFSNSRVAFASDNKMYFGLGTATNSGIVGLDNLWVPNYPSFKDFPGSYILLNGQNFETNNMLLPETDEITYTGAFSQYGEANTPHEVRKGMTRASGGILRANPDGSELELIAWGFRSLSYVKFDEADRLFVTNNGCDVRGSRPIANAPDEFHVITPGLWYGWPDYAGGEPITSSRFKPEGRAQPEFLLMNHPNIPPRPYATFPPSSTIIGFDFNYNNAFGPRGDVYIAEFGSIRPRTYGESDIQFTGAGHRISKINMLTGGITTFAMNKSGFPATLTREGGFGRPADITFGPDGAMYVLDMGTNTLQSPNTFVPNSGVIWKIQRT
jgi:glucose/arabinose dehydrogenase